MVLRSILVPADGSSPSLSALDHALALAEDYGASIVVLDVVQSAEVAPSTDIATESVRAERERALDAAFTRARASLGDRVSRRTVHGDPLRRIVEVAGDGDGFDLIVIGTHGWGGRLHAILGSVAEGVVRNAPCPVLTVRDPREGYQSFAERRHHRPTIGEQAHGNVTDPGHARARGG